MMLRYLSVCSGIEAATVAWHPLGWRPFAFSEIDKFPSAVLAHHYPDVPNLGDMTKFKDWPDATIDLLVGGTPCQSFSVAGLRKGLADPRGNLMLTYLAIADRYRPRWLVWENVPGVLSSGGGRDFGAFLGALGKLGYGWAYRSLDAQYFNLAQRRERVFVVGCLGSKHGAAAVLFERASLSGHPAPRREAGKVAPTIPSRRTSGGGLGTDFDCDGGLIAAPHDVVSPALKARDSKGPSSDGDGDGAILVPMVTHALTGEGFDTSEDGTGRGTSRAPVTTAFFENFDQIRESDVAVAMSTSGYGPTQNAGGAIIAHAFDARQSDVIQYGDKSGPLDTDGHSIAVAFSCKDHGADAGEVAPTLRSMGHDGSHANAGGQVAVAFMDSESHSSGNNLNIAPTMRTGDCAKISVATAMQVRRLTPRECARLQGFPDDYLDIVYRGKPAADGPKYKALGNSMAVPVMAWIGRRIQTVADILEEAAA